MTQVYSQLSTLDITIKRLKAELSFSLTGYHKVLEVRIVVFFSTRLVTTLVLLRKDFSRICILQVALCLNAFSIRLDADPGLFSKPIL